MQKSGIMIMSGFAALWFVWGLSGCGDVPVAIVALPLAVSGLLLFLATRLNPCPLDEQSKRGTVAAWSSLAEGIAIALAIGLLHWSGLDRFDVCAVAAIVGLHFIPFGHFLREPAYNVLAVLFVAIAATALAIPDPIRVPLAAITCATVLWAACALSIKQGTRTPKQATPALGA